MFLITTLASIGLPTLNNFVGELLVLQGAAIANFSWAVFAAIGVILSAVYMLWMYQTDVLRKGIRGPRHITCGTSTVGSGRRWCRC